MFGFLRFLRKEKDPRISKLLSWQKEDKEIIINTSRVETRGCYKILNIYPKSMTVELIRMTWDEQGGVEEEINILLNIEAIEILEEYKSKFFPERKFIIWMA